LAAGFLVARQATDNEEILAAGALMGVVVSSPAATCGLVYNYATTALSGLAIYFLVIHQRSRSRMLPLIYCGTFAGLNLFAKQNVGLAVAAALLLFILFDSLVLSRDGVRTALLAGFRFILGLAVGFGLPLTMLGSQSGSGHILRLIFQDGVSEKGGLLHIAVRIIPRLGLVDLKDTAYFRTTQIVVSLVIMAVLLALGMRRLHFRWRTNADAMAGAQAENKANPTKIWVAWLSIVFFSGLSLLPLPAVTNLGGDLASLLFIKQLGFGIFLGQIIYLAVLVAFGLIAAVLLGEWLNHIRLQQPLSPIAGVEMLLFFSTAALTAGTVTASIMYFPFAAPVVVPLFVFGLKKYFSIPLGGVNLATAVMTGLAFLHPGYATTFQRLERLPANSPFATLYSSPARATEVWQTWREVRPLIDGKTTIWLAAAGPHSAFGGLPAPNITAINCDTHATRTQDLLVNLWNRQLPERIVWEPVLFQTPSRLPVDTHCFAFGYLSRWIAQNYDLIYQNNNREVWAKKQPRPSNIPSPLPSNEKRTAP
jgi:hypothetical protein